MRRPPWASTRSASPDPVPSSAAARDAVVGYLDHELAVLAESGDDVTRGRACGDVREASDATK
jgi:hypothetical protein